MKVFTYFTQIDCLNDPQMLNQWKRSWLENGWEPIILTVEDAEKANPEMFHRFHTSPLLKSCPSNPTQYTLAALLRWVAMTAIDELAIHVDWDVMCRGFKPHMVPDTNVPTYYTGSYCPCAISANGRGWKLIAHLLETLPYSPRFRADDLLKDSCDQYALSIQPSEFGYIVPDAPCKNHNDPDASTATMLHFPNSQTSYPRSSVIHKVMNI